MPYQDLAYDAGPEDVQQKGADAQSEDFPVEGTFWHDENGTITYLTYEEFVGDVGSVAKPLTNDSMPTLVRVINGEPFTTMKNRFFIAFASTNGNVIRTLYDFNKERLELGGEIFQPPGAVKCGEFAGIPIFEADPNLSQERPTDVVMTTTSQNGTTTTTTQNSTTGETTSTTDDVNSQPNSTPATPSISDESTAPSTVTDPPPTGSTGTAYDYEVMKPGFNRYDFNSGKKVDTIP